MFCVIVVKFACLSAVVRVCAQSMAYTGLVVCLRVCSCLSCLHLKDSGDSGCVGCVCDVVLGELFAWVVFVIFIVSVVLYLLSSFFLPFGFFFNFNNRR